MRKHAISSAMLFGVLIASASTSAIATVTTSPSPITPSPVSTNTQGSVAPLTPQQKTAVRDAKKTLASSILTAKSAYGLLIADAKANRDQLLMAAKKDATAIEAAKAKYRADLLVAQSFLNEAIKQARKVYADSLSKAGISTSQ